MAVLAPLSSLRLPLLCLLLVLLLLLAPPLLLLYLLFLLPFLLLLPLPPPFAWVADRVREGRVMADDCQEES